MMTRPRHILLGLMLTICCSQGVEYMLPMLEGREQLSVVAGERGGSCEVQSISKVNVKTYESYHLGMEGKFKKKGTGIVNNTVTIKASNVQIYTSTGPNVYSPLPVSALGTKYIVSCCNLPTIRNHSSSIVIITHSYKADVNITFRLEGNVNYDNRIYTDGDTLTVSLQEYQTLKIFSDWDLTGTVVRSTQTVAVFIVTNDRSFPEWLRASAQLLPVHLYGQEYVVAVDDSPILYQLEIVSEASDTRITFNDGSTVTMDESGIFRQNITSNNTVLYFSSSKPVMTMLCRLDMYGTGAWKRDNFLAIRPVSFYTKETSVSTNTLHTLKILTDKSASDTTMRINSTERPILEWEEIPGSRYKVGTAVTSYDWSTVSVISSTSFTVLLFASGFMFTGGYNISQPTRGIGEEYIILNLRFYVSVSAVAGKTGGWCEVQSISKVGFFHGISILRVSGFVKKRTGIENNTVLVNANNVHIYHSFRKFSPLPISALGTKYIVSSCLPPGKSIYSLALVIATHSHKTDVDITFRLEGKVNYNNRFYTDGDTLTVSLEEYQTLTIFSDWDLTGTVVRSTQIVAVFSALNLFKPFNKPRLVTQLLPVHLHGQEYVVAVDDYPDLYHLQIVNEASNTRITFNDGSTVTMDERGIFKQNITSNATLYFSSSRPVMTMICRLNNTVVLQPVSLYTKQTSVILGHDTDTVKILTEKQASDTTLKIGSTKIPLLEWEEIPGSRYKVGTSVPPYDWESASITSNTSFTVLMFDQDNMYTVFNIDYVYTGGYNSSQPTREISSCEINNASFGEDCTNARCVDANSMCVNSGGNQICTCANRYIWTGSTCTIGPTALTTNQTLEYPTDLSNTPVTLGTLSLDLLSVLTSLVTWDTSVTIYPDEKILRLTKINQTSYEISLQSVIDGDKTIVVALKAVSGDFQVQQIVTVHVKSVPRSVEVFNIFLVQGTRKDTTIADISRLARGGGSFQIQTSDDTANALFAVTQEGLVVCGRDISLDEVANTNIIAKEYNFHVTVDKDGTITKIAKLNVLIFKDKFQSDVRENWVGVIMRYSLSNGNNFLLEPKNVPAVAKLSTVDKSITLDDGVNYESLVKKSIEFEVEVKTRDDSMNTTIAVIIRITDENDETPNMKINADGNLPKLDFYLFEILAGSPKGTIVGVVDSMDRDTVGATSYILGGAFKDNFKVDDSGTIRSTVPLQKAVFGPQFNLTVSATDGVRTSEPVNAVILLSSITEDTKNLNKTFRYSVPEGRVAGEIGNVSLRNYTSYNFTNFLALKMFSIDPLTGIVRTIRPLDRESDSTPTDFSVQAILDSEDQCHLVILGQLVVTIEDVNDMSPRFSQNSYTANMTEGSPVGTSITTLIDIEVFDDDAGPNAELSFELSGRDEQYFRVEMNNRNRFTITTSNIPVDLEALAGDTLTFSLIAKDNPDNVSTQLRTTATITIIVQDANDNAPTFSSSLTYSESEDNSILSPVTTLSARDTDKTYNIITYHLITGGSGFFKIEESTGLLSTAKVLDRETTEKYLLTVHAVDNGIPKLTGTATVTVSVTDINDNSPIFTGSHIVDVKENCSSHIVTTVTATDADVGSNGNVRYSMSDSYFNVSPNGQVRCAMPLDFEKNSSHLLTIVATDLGSPSLSSSTTLTVNVMDVNDNSPIFGSTSYSVTIKRAEWEKDKPILVLDVTDEDSGTFGEITNLTLDTGLFSISGSNAPVLRVISADRKPSGPMVYTFNVTATDGGGLKGQTNVTVNVTGDDVKGIRFQQNDFLLAMEEEKDYSSTEIGNVIATSNQGITVEYEIIDRTDFIIDKTTGAITCKKPQDREKDGNQHFIVRAKDSKGKVPGDLAVVNVTVTDINDNAPEFLQSEESLYLFITENPTLDTFVGQIKAVDKDDGKNAELEYSIESQTPKIGFQINKSSGQISVSAEIDREEATQYILTIKVMDKGVPSRKSATTAAKITVFDVNDVTPYFNPTAHTVPLRESKQVGDFVMTVSARDDDYADNGTVSYEVQVSSDCPFSISKGGEITLSKNLDYERDQEHECVILAKDMWVTCQSACVGQLTGTTTITVSVVDVNDNPPIFQNLPYRANVSRNAAIGDVVTSQIQATDADSKQQGNGVVKFFIISNQDYFQIDRDSGEITVATSLYKIKDDSVRLVLEARDTPQSDSEKKTQTSITINITSEKPRPFFNKTYTVDLTEHAEPSNQPLMRIEAFVQRLGGIVVCNGVNDCQYSIETSADAFDINPDTGDIRQKRELDREEVDGTILVTVKVIDKKYNESKTTDVRVNVQDINDNLPYFENLNATFIVNHKAKVNTTFGRLASKDRDLVSDPLYTIREIDDTNELKIGLWPNGSLYVRQSLLSWNETIEFDVKVDDNDTVISSKDTFKEENRQQRVFVFVRDENYNEHAPQFTKQVYEGYVKSLSKMGTSVNVDLRAYDADNDTVKYSIVRGNIRDTFSIDPVTARLTLQYDLDDSVPDELVLDVAAVDVAVPPKTGFCVVKIEVRDPTEIECIRQSEFDSLRTQSSQRTLFLGLFIALAVLLTAVIIYAIFTTYKWRRAVARGSRYNQNLQDAAKAGKETTGYDGLHGRKQETGYDQLGLEDFSGGVRNPGYVSAGSVGSSSMCQLPVGSPPEEPQPDY